MQEVIARPEANANHLYTNALEWYTGIIAFRDNDGDAWVITHSNEFNCFFPVALCGGFVRNSFEKLESLLESTLAEGFRIFYFKSQGEFGRWLV